MLRRPYLIAIAVVATGLSRCARHPRSTPVSRPPTGAAQLLEQTTVVARGVSVAPFAVSHGRVYWVDQQDSLHKRTPDGRDLILARGTAVADVGSVAAFEDRVIWNNRWGEMFTMVDGRAVVVDLPSADWMLTATEAAFFALPRRAGHALVRIEFGGSVTRFAERWFGAWGLCAGTGPLVVGADLAESPLDVLGPRADPSPRTLDLRSLTCDSRTVVGYNAMPPSSLQRVSLASGKVETLGFAPLELEPQAAVIGDSAFVFVAVPRRPHEFGHDYDEGSALIRVIEYPMTSDAGPKVIASWLGCPGRFRADGQFLYWVDLCEGTLSKSGPFST